MIDNLRNCKKLILLILNLFIFIGLSGCGSLKCDSKSLGVCIANQNFLIQKHTLSDSLQNGIIGGRAVNENWKTAKSTVAVYNKFEQALCTGTLIESNVVLTAAHCVGKSPTDLVIIFNTDLNCDSMCKLDVKNVKNIQIYPTWNKAQNNLKNTGDIALLKFEGSLPTDFEVADVIQDFESIQNGSDVILVGYGVSNGISNSGSGKLRQVHVFVENAHFSESEVQLNQTDGNGACHGDSGGPAYIVLRGKYFLWGITSRGEDGCNSSSIYTRVDFYFPWIKSEIAKLKK